MRRPFDIFRRWRQCEDGATAVEFSLIGTVMIVASLGIMEVGRGFYLYNRLAHAADLAARKVLTKPDITDGAVLSEIIDAFTGEETTLKVAISSASSGTGSSIVKFKIVEITLIFKPLIPQLISDAIDLRVVRRVPMIP